MKNIILFTALFLTFSASFSQTSVKWYRPAFVEGSGNNSTTKIYNRLPDSLEQQVRKPVWDLSLQTAGEFIHFRTTATGFTVRYATGSGRFSMPHMPSTGVSGLDLFARDVDGNWNWAPGSYHFGDTCTYVYGNLYLKKNRTGVVDFYLYLPLYNSIRWLEIGIPEKDSFAFVPKRKDLPVVAYGTSILQGGIASRPGFAWTNILHRKLDRTVINLGFSGNGRFEKPIFDFMSQIDAKLYILDCMPNLTSGFSEEEVRKRVEYGIQKLREQDNNVPILLVEHAVGYGPFYMDTSRLKRWHNSSLVIRRIYNTLTEKGQKNIYLLTEEEIGFDVNSTTEGLHPNDIGMMKYAVACEKKIREILGEPKGELITQIPIEQYRDGYDWYQRHEDVKKDIRENSPNTILFANSIIHYFGGTPMSDIQRGEAAWNKYLKPLKVQNAGFGWDRIENVLWRIYHGELDDFQGKNIMLMIGTNNITKAGSFDEILGGLDFLFKVIKERKPGKNIIMAGILPRKGIEKGIAFLNIKIKEIAEENGVRYVDFGDRFLKDQVINQDLFLKDGVHPDAAGNEVLGKAISEVLNGIN